MTPQDLIGRQGGHDASFYHILGAEYGAVESHPSIKDGHKLSWTDPDYWTHKTTVIRQAILCTVAGNPVQAEYDMTYPTLAPGITGALADGPHRLCVFLD